LWSAGNFALAALEQPLAASAETGCRGDGGASQETGDSRGEKHFLEHQELRSIARRRREPERVGGSTAGLPRLFRLEA